MFNFLNKLFNKTVKKKKMPLTLKGKYLKAYLKKIIDGEWTEDDYFEAYEKIIEDGIERVEQIFIRDKTYYKKEWLRELYIDQLYKILEEEYEDSEYEF